MLDNLINLPLWGYLGVALLLTHITIASVTIFLHRHQAHKALELHPLVSHFFRFWLWLTTGMVTKEWVAIHRKHHVHCESRKDPHSPQIFGIGKVLLQGAGLYRLEAKNLQTLEKYGAGTPCDWLERNVYTRFRNWGIVLMFLLDCWLFGLAGIAIWIAQIVWIPFWAAGVINGLGHFWGYRNFETQDASTNLSPIGILIGGEELHNNHHAYPTSARLSNKWWEFDIGWFYIRTLQLLGLARIKNAAPKTKIKPGKSIMDLETVRAIVRNRFHILTLYGRHVILPVLHEEYERADNSCRRLLKRARRLMIREGIKLDEDATQTLKEALHLSRTLATVYEYKEQLKELWTHSYASHENRLQRLKEWCAQAEQTGIQALQDFACTLRSYSAQPF